MGVGKGRIGVDDGRESDNRDWWFFVFGTDSLYFSVISK